MGKKRIATDKPLIYQLDDGRIVGCGKGEHGCSHGKSEVGRLAQILRLDRLSIHKGVEIKKRDGNT